MNDEAERGSSTHAEFLTARQLAAVLKVSESTVRRLAREGRIPVIRLTPRLARYQLAAVIEALDGKARTPAKRKPTDAPPTPADAQLSFEDLL